jgi:ABC-type uncharacterized transport system permease subunit
MQTGSSKTLIGWKSGKTTFVPLWERLWLMAMAVDSVPDVNGECDVHIGFGTAVVGHAVLLTRHACAHVANNVPCRDTTCDI